MIQVDEKIISLDIFETYFMCDLNSCKGACCVEGDSGAPLLKEEEEILKEIYTKVKPYMSKKGIFEIENQGVAIYDKDRDLTTPLINNLECAFVVEENGVSFCSIEKAYLEGKTNFQKPISCHLFPIRVQTYKEFEAINYEKLKICRSACNCGNQLKIPLYIFLKKPLIRKYGEKFYKKLLKAANLYKSKN